MKKILAMNVFSLLIVVALFALIFIPQSYLGFEAYNRYLDIPPSQTVVQYKLPGRMPYTLKYISSPDIGDGDISFSVNGVRLEGVESMQRGDKKTFRCDIPERYFAKGDNKIEIAKKKAEPEGFLNKITLRNFIKNVFDLNIYVVIKPSVPYADMLVKGSAPEKFALLLLYFALLVAFSVFVADGLLLKFTEIGAERLLKWDMIINSTFIAVTAVFALLQFVLPYLVILSPVTKFFSVFVFLQLAKFSCGTLFYFKGRLGDRVFTLFMGFFVSFVLFLLTDMEIFAQFFAVIAYILLAASVIILCVQYKREKRLENP